MLVTYRDVFLSVSPILFILVAPTIAANVSSSNLSESQSSSQFLNSSVSLSMDSILDKVTEGQSRTISPIQESNETKTTCVNKCRMMDLDLDSCWKESLEFHATELADKLENFYSALLHVEYWRSINDKTNESPDLEENVINKTTEGIRPKNELSNDDIHAVLMSVLQKARERKAEYEHKAEDVLFLPSLPCPIPCDYYPQMWMTLSVVLAVALGLCILVFVLYFFCDAWSPVRRSKFHLI